jgi:hypothetical protein
MDDAVGIEEHLSVTQGSERLPPIETPVNIAGDRRLPEGTISLLENGRDCIVDDDFTEMGEIGRVVAENIIIFCEMKLKLFGEVIHATLQKE